MEYQILILLLAFAGLFDALYFTLAYYGRIQRARWVPEILCASERSSCVTVVKTPYARVFGVPNSLLGILYYAAIIWWAGLGGPVGLQFDVGGGYHLLRIRGLLVLASVVTVALGAYLVYALRRTLGVNCPLCYAAHAINLALMVLLIVSGRD
jgi:uncharacterized membrane protein